MAETITIECVRDAVEAGIINLCQVQGRQLLVVSCQWTMVMDGNDLRLSSAVIGIEERKELPGSIGGNALRLGRCRRVVNRPVICAVEFFEAIV